MTAPLRQADQPACQSYARITITDCEGATARGCPRHAVAALNGLSDARVDSKGLNEWQRKAIELAEERSQLPKLTVRVQNWPSPRTAACCRSILSASRALIACAPSSTA